jgi:peptidoglycan L-alanyl-D-glutamate endopeptidase CwlK
MDTRSQANLKGVHPDLVRVITQVLIKPSINFIVIHGVRDLEEEEEMVKEGKSTTLHSRHLPNEKGFGCAVDVAALVGGHVSWQPHFYEEIWTDVERAAHALKIPVEWGGDWKLFKDYGHFQLPWNVYP